MLLASLLSALAVAAPPPSGPQPAWVEPVDVDVSVPELVGPVRRGAQYLLVDHQARIAPDGSVSSYAHMAYRIETAEALDSLSRLELDYDPYSSRVALHRLEVWREGAWRDRLARSESVEVEREEGLWQHILDGTSTLVIVPEDVRVGDIVRYAWTIEDTNPHFGSQAARSWQMAWTTPAHRRALRVLHPQDTPLRVALHGDLPPPKSAPLGTETELRWDMSPVPAVQPVDDTPFDHVVWPWVQVSTFPDWASVVGWALEHYELDEPLDADVAAIATELAPASATEEVLFAAALRWVQDEVRYFGVELGAGSYRPRPPGLVLRRRYGDCKDKAQLLVALLRARGVQAWPALVNTADRSAIHTWLPAPTDFDHVIVVADVDGRMAYVDPTRRHQGGPADRVYVPDYGKALLVRPGETDLVDIERAPDAAGRLETRSQYTVSHDQTAIDLQVETCSEGGRAERFRAWLSDETPDGLQDLYAGYYRRGGTTVTTVRPISVQDDRQANRLCIDEHYALDGAWYEDDDRWVFDTFEPELMGDLPSVDDPERDAPLALPLGLHEVEEVVIVAPSSWSLVNAGASVRTPWFRYGLESVPSEAGVPGMHGLVLRYSLEIVADQVPSTELDAYRLERERVRDSLGYQLTRSRPGDTGDAGLVMLVAVIAWASLMVVPPMGALGLVTLVYFWVRRRRPAG